MKRRLLKLGLFLLAGAIINVAVAWGCAIWSRPTTTSEIDRRRAEALLEDRGFHVRSDDSLVANTTSGLGLRMRQLALQAADENGTSVWSIQFMTGLPCSSLSR